MKLKSKTVKYPTESALDNHLLESVLPTFITRAPYETVQLPKSREFYRSEEFIWNNPYRSSKKTFRYFHQTIKDNEPRLEELKRHELTERQQSEQQRIQCIRDLRQEELRKMEQRKRRRKHLEQESGQRRRMDKPIRPESVDHIQLNRPERRGKSEAPLGSNKRILDLEKTFQRDADNEHKIIELIRQETLKNRQDQCEKLRKRHEKNSEAMNKAGLKTQSQWNWATIRTGTRSRELPT